MGNDSHIVSARERLAHSFNGSAGNVAISGGEVKEQGATYVGCKVQVVVNATAVITDCRVDARSGRRHIGKQSSHAKPH
jgi:non-canonical (house-cleaning) NTP pyrophosphatase